jgi:hypothetical protein
MLTLLKQARAYGLGCVLATQNPVDLDYKGLSNTGTWFLGRLQTERDKARVLDGLEGAATASGAGFDRADTERILSGLGSRVFLMNNVHDDAPVLFHTRWAMSYLRGPLTRTQIKQLVGDAPAPATSPPTSASPAAAAPKKPAKSDRPVVSPDVSQGFLDASQPLPDGATLLYRPALLSGAQLHFAQSRRGIDSWRTTTVLAMLGEGRTPANPWAGATWSEEEVPALSPEGEPDASFAPLPSGAGAKKSYTAWEKRLKSIAYKEHTLPLWHCAALKAWSDGEESEGEFRARLADLSREKRDLAVEKLRKRYAPKLRRLNEKIQRAEDKIGVQEAQLAAQKQSTLISAGTAVLGALFGRKTLTTGTAGRVGTALRRGSRISKEKEDVERALRDAEEARESLAELEAEFEEEVAAFDERPDPASFEVDARPLRPRKGDLVIESIRLAWTPWALGSDGIATPLFEI